MANFVHSSLKIWCTFEHHPRSSLLTTWNQDWSTSQTMQYKCVEPIMANLRKETKCRYLTSSDTWEVSNEHRARMSVSKETSHHRSKRSSVTPLGVLSTRSTNTEGGKVSSCLGTTSCLMKIWKCTWSSATPTLAWASHAHSWQWSYPRSLTTHSEWPWTLSSLQTGGCDLTYQTPDSNWSSTRTSSEDLSNKLIKHETQVEAPAIVASAVLPEHVSVILPSGTWLSICLLKLVSRPQHLIQ